MRKSAALIVLALLLVCLWTAAPAEKAVTLTFAGDCTLGTEERTRRNSDSFDTVAEEKGYAYFFANFRDLFAADDCTVVNCEGVLSDSAGAENKSKPFRFRGGADFAKIFAEGSVELVSLANNHIKDYGNQGIKNTKKALEDAGIAWAYGEDIRIIEKDGIRIAFASIDYGIWANACQKVKEKLLKLREKGEINAAVLLVHQGKEYSATHRPEQDTYAEYYITRANAELVVMHHSHVLQGIRILDNRTILYSLGNFVFGGSSDVTRGVNGTNSLYTVAAQVKLYFTDEGVYKGQQVTLYPAYDSGTDPVNNYQPVRVTAEEAGPVLAAIQADTEWELPPVWTDENGRAYVQLEYLPAGADTESAGSGEPEPAAAHPDRSNR